MLSCKECKNKCKNKSSLKKHMMNIHNEHQCKKCKQKLPTFMDILKHLSKHHCTEQGIYSEEDESKTKEDLQEEREKNKVNIIEF